MSPPLSAAQHSMTFEIEQLGTFFFFQNQTSDHTKGCIEHSGPQNAIFLQNLSENKASVRVKHLFYNVKRKVHTCICILLKSLLP